MESMNRRRRPPGVMRGAIVGTVALITVFAPPQRRPSRSTPPGSNSWVFPPPDVSMTIVMYLFGVLSSVLFFAGSLSDASGRKPTVGAALARGVAGCLLFIGCQAAPCCTRPVSSRRFPARSP